MTCPTTETFDDRLDGLLSDDERTAFDLHVETCGACAHALIEAEARHALLATPYPVSAPAADMKTRIRLGHARRTRRGLGRTVRYAASFAAGVLVTLAVNALTSPTSAVPVTQPPAADELPAAMIDTSLPPVPRRIH